MATLEKIRSRSVLLVSIIFIALFLFIITIIDNPLSLLMDQTTVAKVKGEKIDYEQYQAKAQELREQNPNNVNADEQALQALISETLFQQEFDKLGLTVTPNEISNAIVGENAPGFVVNSFMQQFGAAPQDVLTAISNPESMGINAEQAAQLTEAYKRFEKNIEQFLLGQKFFMLAGGAINANKLDAQTAFDEANTTYTLATVSKNIFTVQDSVTEAEIKAYYKAHKAPYRLNEPSRWIKYVTLDIIPSTPDRQKGIDQVTEAMNQLAQVGPTTRGFEYLNGNSTFNVNTYTGDSTQVAELKVNGLADFLNNATPGEAKVVSSNAYGSYNPSITMARLISRQTRPNGAKVKRAIIDPAANTDSIIALLNKGIAPDSIKGIAQNMEIDYNFSQIPAQQVDSVRNAAGKYVAFNMGQYIIADALSSLDPAKPMYEYATATLNIEPSRETIDQLNTRMRDFLIVATNAEAFNNDNSIQQGLTVSDALITPSSPAINGMEDTRSAIAWAMDADKGDVSRLYTNSKNTRLMAVAVADIYKDDYAGLSFPPIHEEVENEAINQKRADKLIAQYNGKAKTLAEYAKLMDAPIDTLRFVNPSQPRYGALGALPVVAAKKAGKTEGPIRMNSQVIVYNILDAKKGDMPYDELSNKRQYNGQMQEFLIGQGSIENLLLGDNRIQNRILKFTRQ